MVGKCKTNKPEKLKPLVLVLGVNSSKKNRVATKNSVFFKTRPVDQSMSYDRSLLTLLKGGLKVPLLEGR